MKSDSLLIKAALLAKKRNYEGAFRILKNEEDRYNGSFKYYYLYGIISLHSGSYVEAHEFLQFAKRIKYNDVPTLLGLAVLYLKRMNTVQAVDYYLDVLEKDPKNKIAKNALAVIRKYTAAEELSDWMTPERLSKFFPPIPAPAVNKKVILTGGCCLLAAIVIFSILITARAIPNPFKKNAGRPAAEFVLSREERSDPVQIGGSYRYIMTSNQVIQQYERALSLFASYRDEAAKINLNRILESNASEGLKNRSRILMNNMLIPGFDNFNRLDNPSYSDVKNEPVLYRDVHVIWRGMATNIEVTEEHTSFDFLVGYDTRRTLEGIIPVIFNEPVAINPDRPLEVLGRITLAASYTEIRLDGVALHQSGRLE